MGITEARQRELCEIELPSGALCALLYDGGRFFTEQQFGELGAVTIELPTTREAFTCHKYARGHGRIREPFPVPVVDEEPDPPDESAPALPLAALAPVSAAPDGKRRCAAPGCSTILSRFNEGDSCACHV